MKSSKSSNEAESIVCAFENHRISQDKHYNLLLDLINHLDECEQLTSVFKSSYENGPSYAFFKTMQLLELHFNDSIRTTPHKSKMEKEQKLDKPSRHLNAKLKINKTECKEIWNFERRQINEPLLRNINALTISSQELEIISELLHILIGIEGDSIIVSVLNEENYSVSFIFPSGMHGSLKDLAEDIIPLSEYYAVVQHLINVTSSQGSGLILQALSSAIRLIIMDYYSSIAHLESLHSLRKLNLHKLLFFLKPIIKSMQKLANFSTKLNQEGLNGANALSLLHTYVIENSGDAISQQIFLDLIQVTAKPYMEMIKLWIFKGNIDFII